MTELIWPAVIAASVIGIVCACASAMARAAVGEADGILAEMAAMAQEHLRVGLDEALAMLDRGELDGTALEVEFRTRLFLLGDEPRGRKR